MVYISPRLRNFNLETEVRKQPQHVRHTSLSTQITRKHRLLSSQVEAGA